VVVAYFTTTTQHSTVSKMEIVQIEITDLNYKDIERFLNVKIAPPLVNKGDAIFIRILIFNYFFLLHPLRMEAAFFIYPLVSVGAEVIPLSLEHIGVTVSSAIGVKVGQGTA
jgi:hypothetical protein